MWLMTTHASFLLANANAHPNPETVNLPDGVDTSWTQLFVPRTFELGVVPGCELL